VSPDGKFVAAGDDKGDVTIWDWRQGKQVHLYHGYAGHLTALSFGGGNLAALGSRDLVMWNLRSQDEWLKLPGVRSFAFSPDSRTLAVAEPGTTQLLDLNLERVKDLAKQLSRKPSPDECAEFLPRRPCP
jgi:WD40 repeat protein